MEAQAGTPGRTLEVGTEAEATEESSSWLAQLFSYTAQDHLPRGGPALHGLSPPTLIIRLESAMRVGPTTHLVDPISQLKCPSSQLTLVCVRQTETNQPSVDVSVLYLTDPTVMRHYARQGECFVYFQPQHFRSLSVKF